MIHILPTDTCYGLSGAFTKEDYEEIYRLKGRTNTKQLALLVEDFDDMKPYVSISDEQIEFLRSYPYPWSFLGVRNPEFKIPDWMDGSMYEKISLRVAKICMKNGDGMIENLDFPLFLTSANLSGQKESNTLREAQVIFPHVRGIDGGVCDGFPSDIFSIDETGTLEYLRKNYGK